MTAPISKSSTPSRNGAVIHSLLDTDLYKLTMQQAVLLCYPDADVSYWFTNRSPTMKFTQEAVDEIQVAVDALQHLALRPDERKYLEKACPYLQPAYVDYLANFRFNPASQVKLCPTPSVRRVPQEDGTTKEEGGWFDLHLTVTGKWLDAILYEVPLMAIISEVYFRVVDTDWSMDGQEGESPILAKASNKV